MRNVKSAVVKKYTEWDYESKKCPKCKDGIIGESEGGVLIMAD